MARGDHHSGGAAQARYGKGEGGHGLDPGVHEYLDAIRGEDLCGDALESLRVVARVAAEGDARTLPGLRVGIDPVGEALHRLRDHVHVHAVGPHAHDAANTCGAKGEVSIEGIEELVLMAWREKRA